MGQLIKRLSDRAVQNASPEGNISRFLPDGAGLYLQVSPTGTKSWVFRYSVKARERYMGLGPFPDVSLADARGAANDCRKLRRQDIDPIDHRAGQRAEALLAAAATKTFRECASVYIESKKDGWKNAKHAAQWTATLETYAYPVIGDLPVQTVDTALVEKVLKPIWASKTETASRVRGRIESVIDWATVQGYRKGIRTQQDFNDCMLASGWQIADPNRDKVRVRGTLCERRPVSSSWVWRWVRAGPRRKVHCKQT
jgi:hypothetical protein